MLFLTFRNVRSYRFGGDRSFVAGEIVMGLTDRDHCAVRQMPPRAPTSRQNPGLLNCIRPACLTVLCCLLCAEMQAGAAGAGPVPDTGQDRCYDDTTVIECPGPGEPFFGQDAQYLTTPRSFSKLDSRGADLPDDATEWAMVRDEVTGLVWEVKTDDGSIHDVDDRHYSWDEARDAFIPTLNGAGFGGFDDWRLPTVRELSLLVNRGRTHSAADSFYFPQLSLYYWSSTPDPSGAAGELGHYYVQFDEGYAYNYIKGGDGAMAVRGTGPDDWGTAFVDHGDGTVTDTVTGLMWQQIGPTDAMNWRDALAYCEALEFAGHTDWRLPDVNELQSLVDYSRCGPSIDTDAFPETEPAFYRTATTIAGTFCDQAWVVDFNLGYVDLYFGSQKSALQYVRAVRGGVSGIAGDMDGDGVSDSDDTCPAVHNPQQTDTDGDGIGDACQNPNLITLAAFQVNPGAERVTLTWTTGSEIDTAGFNIYRAGGRGAAFVRVNPELIPARGSAAQGARYVFTDRGLHNRIRYRYLLEDVDLAGMQTRHGPVQAVPRALYKTH